MATFLKCIFGPRLFRLHKTSERQGRIYEQNGLESGCENLLTALKVCKGVCYWTSPFVLIVLWRRGWFTVEGVNSAYRLGATVGLMLFVGVFFRAFGRYFNGDYIEFLSVLRTANSGGLVNYDFDFRYWPVNYRVSDASVGDGSKPRVKVQVPHKDRSRPLLDKFKTVPCYILSYLAANTFGRRMLYPGSTSLLNAMLHKVLVDARGKLVETKNGCRAKILTDDGNEIDTMFLDRRSTSSANGKTLVVCSEGNAAFYEMGCCDTPLQKGYSVLGWNHPGFAGSSGVPWPSQEQSAIDGVMQYAINQLGFLPQDIILFSWSIGGYCSSWAAMNYPDVKALILDATFDHVTPLAIERMPASCVNLVRLTMKTYLNLNIAEQVCRYPGPVRIIRRTMDEMISTDPSSLKTNRGNDLLIKLLQHRYPCIVKEATIPVLRDWLALCNGNEVLIWSQYEVNDRMCQSILQSYVSEHGSSFPQEVGKDLDDNTTIQLALYLASVHLTDFDSTHCVPLPAGFFTLPWTASTKDENHTPSTKL